MLVMENKRKEARDPFMRWFLLRLCIKLKILRLPEHFIICNKPVIPVGGAFSPNWLNKCGSIQLVFSTSLSGKLLSSNAQF